MKKIILLVAAFAFGSTALFAQKMARIDYQDVIQSMPEMTGVQEGLQKAEADYMTQLENIQVERNKKVDEMQKLPEGTTEAVKQLRVREISDLEQRYQEYLELAQQGMQQANNELSAPLIEKADAAIKKICKADGITLVVQKGSVVYIDEDATPDITAKVKSELGIAATAAN